MNELSAALPSHLTERNDPIAKPKNALGKDDFLKLLMAQLNNQDPLKPMEHQEFSAQLAQFGSLEQLQNIGKGIENLQGGIGKESKLSALGMIGKNVEASGNEVSVIEGQPVTLTYGQKVGVTPVRASIYADGGKVVREVELDGRTNGSAFSWDGKDQDGKAVPSGKYTFRVQGVNQSGQASELGSELSGKVVGVEMEGANPVLVVKTASGTTKLDIGKVRSVGVADETAKPQQPEAAGNPLAALMGGRPQATSNGAAPVSIDLSELQNRAAEGGDAEVDAQWDGMPPFASMQSLKP